MTEYKARSAWTSSARGGAQLTGTKLAGIAWHWPGTSADEIGVESEAATANRLRGYRNFHLSRTWSDIGYNFAIDQAGRVWDLRGLGRVGAHCASPSNPDANHEWLGVLLILGERERPSARMIRACQDFVHDVFLPRWPGRTRDTGHGRAPGVAGAQTSCPGPHAAALIVDDVLTRESDQEDDMTPQELLQHRVKLSKGLQGWFGTGIESVSVEGLLSYAGAGAWEARQDRAKQLKELAAIRATLNAEPVDVTALASELVPLLVGPIVAELGDETGLTEEQAERVLRRVLGSLDDA